MKDPSTHTFILIAFTQACAHPLLYPTPLLHHPSPQVNVEALPEGPENPYGNGFVAKETPLLRESEAQRTNNAASGRYWKVKNPSVINSTTGMLGVVCGDSCLCMWCRLCMW